MIDAVLYTVTECSNDVHMLAKAHGSMWTVRLFSLVRCDASDIMLTLLVQEATCRKVLEASSNVV